MYIVNVFICYNSFNEYTMSSLSKSYAILDCLQYQAFISDLTVISEGKGDESLTFDSDSDDVEGP